MNMPAKRLIYGVIVLATGLSTVAFAADSAQQSAGASQSVGLTNLDEPDTPAAPVAAPAPVPAAAPVAAAPASAPKVPANSAAAKVKPPLPGKPVDGARAVRSAWPDTSKLPAPGEGQQVRSAKTVRPKLDPIAKAPPKPDGSGTPEPLAQHRQEMIDSGEKDKYINSNSAVSRRYLRVDRATYARENKAP